MVKMAWNPFAFKEEMEQRDLEYFTNILEYDEEGYFLGYRRFEYLSEIVDRVMNKEKVELDKTDNILAKYNYGIKRNVEKQKNSDAKKLLAMTNTPIDDSEGRTPYGTINENLVVVKDEDSIFETTNTVDTLDDVMTSLENYRKVKEVFQMQEGVDLDTVIVRALEEIPQAVAKLRQLVGKYPFLGNIIEDVLKARQWGQDVLPKLD